MARIVMRKKQTCERCRSDIPVGMQYHKIADGTPNRKAVCGCCFEQIIERKRLRQYQQRNRLAVSGGRAGAYCGGGRVVRGWHSLT